LFLQFEKRAQFLIGVNDKPFPVVAMRISGEYGPPGGVNLR